MRVGETQHVRCVFDVRRVWRSIVLHIRWHRDRKTGGRQFARREHQEEDDERKARGSKVSMPEGYFGATCCFETREGRKQEKQA